jgi:tetratricopeptide (TPR) repeat protein
VLGFVAFAIFIVVQASKGPNPSAVAYSPAGSTVQDTPAPTSEAAMPASDTSAATPQVAPSSSDTPTATPSPSPALPTATGNAKPEENDSLAQAKFQEAFNAGKQGKYRKSIAAYQKALQLKSDFPEAWSNIGWDYLKEGAMRSAIKAYKQAVEMKPDLADAWNGLAVCYATNADSENTNLAVQNLERLDADRAKQLLCSFSTDFLSKIAVARHPSLGVLDTPMNLEFRRRYDYYKANSPSYFSSPDWPVTLAKEVSESTDSTLRENSQAAPQIPGLSQ